MSNNAPEIRFKGFADAWVQRKLGSVYGNIRNAFVGTATPYYVESEEDGYFYLESNNIKEGQINRNTEVFINEEFYQRQHDKWLHTGDLVMVQSGHVGHTAVIPEELDSIAAHALIMFQNSIDKSDPYFINYQLQTRKSRNKLDYITTGNTIKHILASEMKQFIVDFPVAKEQNAIRNFFRTLDDAITLYKRKLDGLKELKKGYLQQMFPQEGENVPRVRFAGFAEPWAKRKFSTIVDRVSTQSNSDHLPKVEFEDIVSGEGRLNNDISNKFDKRKGILFESNNILYGKLRPYLKNWLFADFKGVALGDFWVFEANNSSPIFDYYLIQSEKYQEVANLSTGTKMPRSDWKTVSETIFSIPSEAAEQTTIGDFFRNLDEQIATHQTELNKLKHLKSAYLQRMFL